MKKSLTMLFCTLSVIAVAQHTDMSLGTEKTVVGTQYAVSLVYEGKKHWGIGPFFQTGLGRAAGESFLKNPFYGIVLQAPLAKSPKISVVGTIRVGFINHNFFAFVPALETRIKVGRNAGFILGAGLRAGYPSMSVKLFAKLFNG